jgi:LysM repeat protein
MYARAVAENLNFLKTPDDLYQAARAGRLKLISVTEDVDLDRVQYPFVLPQTLDFVTRLAAQYHAQCGERLIVTSGARPVDKQPRNAVAESVHPTGMAVDFHRPAQPCVTWLRKALVELEEQGVIEATEERHPPHFHVAVLDRSPRQYAVNVDLKGLKPRSRVETLSGGEVAMSDGAGAAKDSLSARAASSPRVDSSVTTSHDSVAAAEPKRRVEARDSSTARPESESVHRVEAGDNLWTIAQRNHTTVKRLQELNNLPTTKLRTGQQLRLR